MRSSGWSVSAVQHILVPIDLHEHSEQAFPYAEAFAKETGATLHVLHVITSSFRKQKFGEEAERRHGYTVEDEVEAAMEAIVTRLERRGLRVRRHVRSGHVEDEVLRLIDELSVELVVMCAGERLITDEWFASKYVKVFHEADVPVLGLKGCEREFVDRATEEISIKRVSCPCDLEDFSHEAIPIAAAVCRHFGAELVVGHVAHTYEQYASIEGKGGKPGNPVDTREVLEKLLAPYSEVSTRVVAVKGELEQGLVDLCTDEGVDLMVMATHARKPFVPSIVASFTQKLVAAVPCPVMTIRPELLAKRYGQ
jgi:nucleotide-binding universal stress UspA family protein